MGAVQERGNLFPCCGYGMSKMTRRMYRLPRAVRIEGPLHAAEASMAVPWLGQKPKPRITSQCTLQLYITHFTRQR